MVLGPVRNLLLPGALAERGHRKERAIMTNQRDPETRKRFDRYIRREDDSIIWAPIVAFLGFAAVLGLVLASWDLGADRPVTGQRTELPNAAPAAPPAPTPAPVKPQ